MASKPASQCCYQGFRHDGEPRGRLSALNDVEIYISHPPGRSASYEYGILILSDIIGHRFVNSQLIADQFADQGYLVLVPDLFFGDAVPLNKPEEFDMQNWRTGFYAASGAAHTPNEIDPIVAACIAEMRDTYQCSKVGGIGYCFGAKYVVRHLQAGKIDAGCAAHPSHIEISELQAVKGPLAIAAAEEDVIFPKEKRYASEAILQEAGVPYQINLYSGVKHGFAVRGDVNSQIVRYAKEDAFRQAVGWFNQHLKHK